LFISFAVIVCSSCVVLLKCNYNVLWIFSLFNPWIVSFSVKSFNDFYFSLILKLAPDSFTVYVNFSRQHQ
jgi:hypothetical protein